MTDGASRRQAIEYLAAAQSTPEARYTRRLTSVCQLTLPEATPGGPPRDPLAAGDERVEVER